MPPISFLTNVHFLRCFLIFIFLFIEHENNQIAENPCNICLNVLNNKFYIAKTLKFNPRTNFASSRTRRPNSRENASRYLSMTL